MAHQARVEYLLTLLLVLAGASAVPAAEPPGSALAKPSTVAVAEPLGSVLASYSFDDDVPTGPDTFRIFQYSKGTVRLTSAYHVSGYRAIELRDVAGDENMPEIQGYFEVQSKGRLHAHFSFLTATPKEELNIALAGPRFFQLEKDGIAFWLKSDHGSLFHYTGRVPRKLFSLEAFVWYSVDLVYDVGAGLYDMTIRQEGRDDPLVTLVGQKNAPGQAGSAVDKFSFVGSPFVDTSSVVYYVDDIVIGTSQTVVSRPFVAPGRRKFFVDAFVEYRARESARPRCLPAAPEDFGFTAQDRSELTEAGAMDLLPALGSGEPADASELPSGLTGVARQRLGAALEWSRGCAALDRGDASKALSHFKAATASASEGRIHGLSTALALIALGRAAEADERLALDRTAWGGDARYAVALAMAGTARGDLERAETWLRYPAETAVTRAGSPLLRGLRQSALTPASLAELKRAFPADWQEHLSDVQVSEQYFYVLLWRSQPEAAREYAVRMANRFQDLDLGPVDWIERAGDAAFYGKDVQAAKVSYDEAMRLDAAERTRYWSLLLKLADIAFVSGDLATETSLREQYYGSLRER
jgi:hypothetical protein